MSARKRRTVKFAASPSPPPPTRPQIEPLQRLTIDSGSWLDVPLTPDSSETTTLSPVPIPTNIHLDLLRASIIRDPHIGTNERNVQWVHERTWRFSTVFYLTLPSLSGRRAELVCEGLDTFATVQLNGKEVLRSENMFLQHKVDITKHVLFMGKQNVVTIVFESAMKRGEQLMAHHGKRVCWDGHYSRPHVRKAQYHYGWDLGPSLVTCGPWKPVFIEIYSARLSGVNAVPKIAPDLASAMVELRAKVDSVVAMEGFVVTATIISPAGKEFNAALSPSGGIYTTTISIPSPELWHPRIHGPQNLYTITYTLMNSSDVVHTITKKFGLRRVEIVREEIPADKLPGSTTYFRINNTPLFAGGSNWIPADSFQPRITREQLQSQLDLMVRGNQNMVKVWGGGVYESEDFYELCDEAGILVWQDICIACPDYPAHIDSFAGSIVEEVSQQLSRLRWHPSLVIVSGSYTNYQVEDEEMGYQKDAPGDTWRVEPFLSRWLYEKEFPKLVTSIYNGEDTTESGVVYWPGAPLGADGDIHLWNLWAGIQAPYQRIDNLGSRSINEFGIPSLPSLATTRHLLGSSPPDPQSETIAHHTNPRFFEHSLNPYLRDNFRRTPGSLSETIFLSQLVQSEAMAATFKEWREKWGEKRHCGGALASQFNDVWPAVSCSITSFLGSQPKQAFYAISRSLAPVTLLVRRIDLDVYPEPISEDQELDSSYPSRCKTQDSLERYTFPPKKCGVSVVLSNITSRDYPMAKAEVRYISLSTGLSSVVLSTNVSVAANENVSLWNEEMLEDSTLVYAVLLGPRGEMVAREVEWPFPRKSFGVDEGFRELGMGVEELRVEWQDEGVQITAEKAVKAVWFEERIGERWADNGVDLVPGETLGIRVDGLEGGGNDRKVWWYGW